MNRERNFDGPSFILYVVATPIGNLQEMTIRAQEILNQVDIIACEDTRNSGVLLHNFNIKKPLVACHEHNESEASAYLIQQILNGQKVAYMSDAGYPGISDPGHRLIMQALDNNIKVSVISGPSALLNALVGSGLPTDHFYFHGFLPSKHSARISELIALKLKTETLIFYESPHRIDESLKDILMTFGNRKACIARELTKKFEEYIRGTLKELVELDSNTLKGELVVVIEGAQENELTIDDEKILEHVDNLIAQGFSTKDAIKKISDIYSISKNYIYKIVIHNNIDS